MQHLPKRLIIAILVFSSAAISGDSAAKKAPNFALKTNDGKTVELNKLKGKAVVINFWATWCGPCRAEIPSFLEVYEKYRAKGLEIVGVSMDEGGWTDVAPFIKQFNIAYPVVLGNERISRLYGGIQYYPTTVFIDKEGTIVDQHIGMMKKEDFEVKVKSIL